MGIRRSAMPLVSAAGFATALLLGAATLQAQLPRGPELRVNRTPQHQQSLSDVAAAPNGDFAVVWVEAQGEEIDSPSNVLLRIYSADGRPRSGGIRVSGADAGRQRGAAVAVDAGGRILVVWSVSGSPSRPADGLFGRRFSPTGAPLGGRFRLTDTGGFDVGVAADGSFVLVRSKGNPVFENSPDIVARRFDARNRPLGPEFYVNTDLFEEQYQPQVAVGADGHFVVAWTSWDGECCFYETHLRLYDRNGQPLGDDFSPVGETYEVQQEDPAIAMAADGRFLVAWSDRGADPEPDYFVNSWGVVARLFAADGTPAGEQVVLNTFTKGFQNGPAVAATPSGGFFAAWMSGGDQDGDDTGIFARRLAADGRRVGPEFRVNLNRPGRQFGPRVAIGPGGKGLVVWNSPDGDGAGVFARRIEPREPR